jgi:hypothetical protein
MLFFVFFVDAVRNNKYLSTVSIYLPVAISENFGGKNPMKLDHIISKFLIPLMFA